MKKAKKTVFSTPWPYTFAMATVDAVELAAWTLHLHIRLAASMQPPDLLAPTAGGSDRRRLW